MSLMHSSGAAGVRYPLRLKLASAFLLVALIPLLVLGASYLLGGIEASNAAVKRGMEDKLRIGGLLWESEQRDLAVTASTIASDNLVILNTELGLSQPIGAYLNGWVERGNCSLAVLLDPAGNLIASNEHWYGSSLGIPVPERYINREAPRPALFFSLDSFDPINGERGSVSRGDSLSVIALHPVWDYRQNLIAWALIGMVIGEEKDRPGESFMTTLEKRLGAPFIVAGLERIYYASDELGEPELPALEPPDPASDEGGAWHSGYLELVTPRGRQMAMFAPLPLPNQADQPLLFLGTVLHADSFFAARNQALAQMLMVLLATLLAAAVLVFFLSRSLSRPISVMAEGAKAIRQGDFNTRLTVSSHDELGALADEFNIMTSRLIETIASLRSAEIELKALNAELEAKVEARTIDLASANLELQAANQGLLRTLAELKEAQDKILVSEKLAVLGRMTAGIAHELNTPLAAISVSARLEMKVFSEGFDGLLSMASRLPREALALLEEARSSAAGRIGIPFAADPPGERRSRREAADVLSKAGIAEADSLADELSELDLASDVSTLTPILAGPAGKDFMTLLRGVVGAYRAARIIEDAVDKASRVVTALRTYSRGGGGGRCARPRGTRYARSRRKRIVRFPNP